MRRATIITAAVFAIWLSAAGQSRADEADQLKDGEWAWGQGDFSEAMALLQPLAEGGNARAQFLVGLMYTVGQGVTQDVPAGVAWFLKSADQGNVDAQYSLGTEYSTKEVNDKFPEDYVQAYVWYSLAAEGYKALGKGNIAGSEEMREITARRLTSKEISEGDEKIAEWKAHH